MDEKHEQLLRDISAKVNETHTLLTNKDIGVIHIVKRHGRTLYGNGWPGLKTQTILLWIALGLLGSDNTLVRKFIGWALR